MSTSVRATLFDGRNSEGVDAQVAARAPESIEVRSGDRVTCYRLSEVSVSSRVGRSTRYLTLPGGEKLETRDNDGVDRLVRVLSPKRSRGILHAIERRWGWVAIAVVFTGLFLWWSVFTGLPLLAERTARAIPISLEDAMGRQSLSALDAHLLSPTRLQETQRERARRIFAQATRHAAPDTRPRLELRRGKGLGPNALALPSGIIIVTDELVALAEHDAELLAVVAHELGHVRERHVVRSLLQNSAVALVLAAVLGDVSSITGLAASIPTLLVEHGFSRSFELEADRYAVRVMAELGVERSHLASILRKIGASHGGDGSAFGDYLSTHPGIERRIDAIDALEVDR